MSVYLGRRINCNDWDAAKTRQDWRRLEATRLVSTTARVLRQLVQPSKILFSIAPLQCQSRNTIVFLSEGTRNAACGRAALWSGFAKIRSAKLNQRPQLPSFQKPGHAASLCCIQTHTIMVVFEVTRANAISSLLPLLAWPDPDLFPTRDRQPR